MITDGISDEKLKWGYWYVTHKVLLRQILTYILIFINLNLWLLAFFFIFKVYFFDNQPFVFAVNQFTNTQVNYSTFNKANQPKVLRFSNIDVLKTSGKKYDLFLMVTNPNTNWAGKISGKFIIGEHEYEDKIFSILGGEGKYVIQAGLETDSNVGSPQFKINYVQWQRINSQNDFNRFVKGRADFDVGEVKYQTPTDLNLGTQVPVSGLNFEIKNNSLYDYWLVNNKILFKRGGSIIALHAIPLEEFRAGQRRSVDFRVFDNLVGVSSVEVKSEVDIFDEENIIEEPLVVGYLK